MDGGKSWECVKVTLAASQEEQAAEIEAAKSVEH